MIFVTVGGQLPFDRLVHAVDDWAAQSQYRAVFAQIGDSQDPPRHIRWQRFLTAVEFRRAATEADAIVAHAGIGTILTALALRKTLLVMPRRERLGEHRNDHQWATVRHLGRLAGLVAAHDERELVAWLPHLDTLAPLAARDLPERQRLVAFLRLFIEGAG